MPESPKPASLHVHYDPPFEWKTRRFDYDLCFIGAAFLLQIVIQFVLAGYTAAGAFDTKTDTVVDRIHTDAYVVINVGIALVVAVLAKSAIQEACRIPFVALLRLTRAP